MAKDPQQSTGQNILASDFDWYGTSIGGTAYAVSMDGVGTSYNEGRIVAFRTGSANVGTATLSINSIGAKNIKVWGPSGLANPQAGELAAAQVVAVTYDATNDCFVLLNAPAEIDRTTGTAVSFSGSGTSFTTDNDAGAISVTLQRSARLLLQFSGAETNRSNNAQAQSFTASFNIDSGTTIIQGYSVSENLGTQGDGQRNGSCSVVTSLLTPGTHTVRMRITGSSVSSMGRGLSGTLYVTILKH